MGLLRFDRFMQHALYHPTHGYYSKHIPTVGRSGDFSTSASISTDLATSIAKWCEQEIRFHQFSVPIHLIEIGAGTGELLKNVRRALPFLIKRKIQFHIVETSPKLRAIQQQTLGSSVKWHKHLSEALLFSKGHALLYSNELVDAFPVRQFRKEADGYSELYIDSQLRSEVFQTISDVELPQSSIFSHQTHSGQRVEVHQSYHDYLREWTAHFQKGSVLTIDYGDTAEELSKQQPQGSLRGYLKHQMVKGDALYQSVGHQDITADVNFTDLIEVSEHSGLTTQCFTEQKNFLTAKKSRPNKYLTDAEGAGSQFKVLLQRKV